MIYATLQHGNRKFLGVVSSQKGSMELSPEEYNQISNLAVEEWLEGVWEYKDEEVITTVSNIAERGEKALKMLQDCVDDEFLDDE